MTQTINSVGTKDSVKPSDDPRDNKPDKATLPVPPNPARILEDSMRDFPGVSQNVLSGTGSLSRFLGPMRTQVEHLAARRVRPLGEAPVLFGSQEKARIALLPTTNVPGPDTLKNIEKYIIAGKSIFDQVMAGNFAGVPGKQEISKLMWYLQALGSAKCRESVGREGNGMFKEGAFLIEDPDGKLQDFLERANSYPRSSSHMRDYQALGDEFKPRGFDLRNVPTPHCRQTLLFQRLPTDEESGQNGPKGTGEKRMLFLKMEPYGCRGLTSRGSGTPRPNWEAPSKWKGFKRFFLNLKSLLSHGWGFAVSLAQRMGLSRMAGENNRERIPSRLKEQWKELSSRLERSGIPCANELRTLLNQREPLSDSAGIKQMLKNITNVQQRFEGLSAHEKQEFAGLGHCVGVVKDLLDSWGDHKELRIGNEVILTRDEMGNLDALNVIRPLDAKTPVATSGQISRKNADILLRSYMYQLEKLRAREEKEPLAQFRTDALRLDYTVGRADSMQLFKAGSAKSIEKTLLQLTGNKPDQVEAILSLAHQGLSGSVMQELCETASAVHGFMALQAARFFLGIERLADNDKGEQVYVISFKGSGLAHNQLPTPGKGLIDIDRDRSTLDYTTELTLTFHANGSITPSFDRLPSYAYSIIPRSPEGENNNV